MRGHFDHPQVLSGKTLFQQARCTHRHVTSYVTGHAAEPECKGTENVSL